MHRLFDPLLVEAATRGAGLDWKTSLQELGAARGLGAPSYVVEDDGPDHAKTFTAAVLLAGIVYGEGAGRTKKAAEQEAAETAWRALSDAVPRPERCPNSLRSRSSAAAWSSGSPAARSPRSRCTTRARSAATSRAPTTSSPPLTGRTFTAAHRRGKYLWLPMAEADGTPAGRRWSPTWA